MRNCPQEGREQATPLETSLQVLQERLLPAPPNQQWICCYQSLPGGTRARPEPAPPTWARAAGPGRAEAAPGCCPVSLACSLFPNSNTKRALLLASRAFGLLPTTEHFWSQSCNQPGVFRTQLRQLACTSEATRCQGKGCRVFFLLLADKKTQLSTLQSSDSPTTHPVRAARIPRLP